MTPDLMHAIASGLLIGLVIFLVQHFGFLDGVSKGKRALAVGAVVFVVLVLFNLAWPGAGAGG